jgi:hypothetical protein
LPNVHKLEKKNIFKQLHEPQQLNLKQEANETLVQPSTLANVSLTSEEVLATPLLKTEIELKTDEQLNLAKEKQIINKAETAKQKQPVKVTEAKINSTPTKSAQFNYPWSHDNKAVAIMKNWYPLRFKLNYPRHSVLNAYEQKDFLDLHLRFRNRTHLNEKEVKSYKLYSVS